MRYHWIWIIALTCFLALLPYTPAFAEEQDVSAAGSQGTSIQVKGKLDSIGGTPVVTVFGTPREQGFAYGYLLQDKIVSFFNRFLESGKIVTAEEYEKAKRKLGLFRIEPRFEEELRGMLEGIEARAGGPVEMPAMGRRLQLDDLLMANCMGDATRIRMSCSSFAAWGTLTEEGNTIGGRNYEWPLWPSLLGVQVVTVRLPPPGTGLQGFVSVFFPGCIGCITAMNAEGVTVSTHDSTTKNPTMKNGFAPITLLYREVMEKTRAESAMEDIAGLLKKRCTITGNNMMVSRPYSGNGPGAFIFEHDADLSDGNGATLRMPGEGDHFLTCTNRYFERNPAAKFTSCWRCEKLRKQLIEIDISEGKKHLTRSGAWRVARSVTLPEIVTYHRVIFEPNKRLMHVAFPADGAASRTITLNVADLLAEE